MDGSGELLLTLLAATAEAESVAMSDNIIWGKLRKAERGDVNSLGGSGKFLGYDKKNGQFIINEEQAAIVRRIYQMFLDGYGSSFIASVLDADGIPMAYGGKHWCNSHIRKVLRNEKYKGDALFNKIYILM